MAMDFSPSSINAYQHAISIAEKFALSINVLWNESKDSIEKLKPTKERPIKTAIEEKLSELNEKYNQKKVETNIIITKGTTYKEVIRVAEEINAELIVVGNHGTHGVRRFFIGDNANKIIASAKCPVLTIQLHRSISNDLKKIVIAIDNTLETRQKIPITTDFALMFGAEVHILGIYSSNVSTMRMRVDSYVKQAYAGLKTKGIPVVTQFISTSDLSKSMLNYAKQINANLIITMVDTEYFTKDMFLGKQGQQLVNQSHIPVLSVHNKEIIKSRPGY